MSFSVFAIGIGTYIAAAVAVVILFGIAALAAAFLGTIVLPMTLRKTTRRPPGP